MKVYLVGGAVRDKLMGMEPKDKDYVVIGSTPAEMLSLGFKQVGADFPVFLHPETGDEYALARIERKISAGYQGFVTNFSPNVTLKDDLKRRDLTINAMAMDEATGEVFDFFGGQEDLKNSVLRHVSDAFKEDPVRILRVARLAARYNFRVADETNELMIEMVQNGEFDSLVAERVWSEIERAFMEPKYWRVWTIIYNCGALEKLPLYKRACYDSFGNAANSEQSLKIRCAAAFQFESEDEFRKNRIPTEISELAKTADKIQTFCQDMNFDTTRGDILNMFMKVDLFRRPERFNEALKVVKFRGMFVPLIVVDWAKKVLDVDCGAVALACSDKKQIADEIRKARIAAMNLN